MKQLKNTCQPLRNGTALKTKTSFFLTIVLLALLLTSCSSVRVASDYDKEANFESYNTFAFFKPGIDKVEISDLDKRRILRAIETELLSKGFTKSENPDLLVSIFTKSETRVDVYNNSWGIGRWGWGGFGPGWGWGGFGGGWNQPSSVSTSTEGVLFIDLIDARDKELIWQGMGSGIIVQRSAEKKEGKINKFVSKIMEKYPPNLD